MHASSAECAVPSPSVVCAAQVERDPGRQPYLDLYMELDGELEDAFAVADAVCRLQKWVRGSLRRWREQRQNQAASVITRALASMGRIKKAIRIFASSTLEACADQALDVVVQEDEIEIIEYFADTAYFLKLAKYFCVWVRFRSQSNIVERRYSQSRKMRVPGRHFRAWRLFATTMRQKVNRMRAKRQASTLRHFFSEWMSCVAQLKLASMGKLLATQSRIHKQDAATAQIMLAQQQIAEYDRKTKSAIVIQALCRGASCRKAYCAKLQAIKTFWAQLILQAKHAHTTSSARQQHWKSQRSSSTPTLLPSQIDECWTRYPCQFPGRLLSNSKVATSKVSLHCLHPSLPLFYLSFHCGRCPVCRYLLKPQMTFRSLRSRRTRFCNKFEMRVCWLGT